MASYTPEQATQMIDQLNQQVAQQSLQVTELVNQITQLLTRAATSDDEHRQMHTELMKHQGQLTQANLGGKPEFRLVDPKTMAPEKLGSNKHPLPQGWRQWADDTRAYVENLSPHLASRLKQVEGLEAKLAQVDIEAAAIQESHAQQLTRYLSLRSEGNANTMIKASIDRGEHPLETWRALSWEHDPKGLGSELIELSGLVSPTKLKAKSIAEISSAIEA